MSSLTRSVLLQCVLLAPALLLSVRQAAAYINVPAPTLGALCQQSTHIYVLKVEKCSAEKGVLIFKPVAQLKASGKLSDATLAKQVIPAKVNGDNVPGAKVIFDWVAEGKTAVMLQMPGEKSKKIGDDAYDPVIAAAVSGTNVWIAWEAKQGSKGSIYCCRVPK